MRTIFALLAALAAVSLSAQNTLVDQGRAAMNRGDTDAAVDLLEKAVAQSPNSAEPHFWLGNAYGSQAQKSSMFSAPSLAKKAREEFEKAVALNPRYVEGRMALVEFYAVAPGFMGGDYDKALAQAQEIKKLDPLRGHTAFAVVYQQQKKPELAKKEYLDGIQEQPTSARAHHYYGQYLVTAEKNFKDALEQFETAVRLDAAYMPAWYSIGRTAGLSGANLPHGEEALKKYLGYKPKDNEPQPASAHYFLGMIYEKLGRKAEAKQQFEAALKLNSSMKSATEALKRVS